jgi:hypothetical protein
MKKILLLLACLMGLTGCGADEVRNAASDDNVTTTYKFKHVVVQVDGCEYLMFKSGPECLAVTHKGNCKFCLIRYHAAPEMDPALESIEKRRNAIASAVSKLTDEEKAALGLR